MTDGETDDSHEYTGAWCECWKCGIGHSALRFACSLWTIRKLAFLYGLAEPGSENAREILNAIEWTFKRENEFDLERWADDGGCSA